MKKINIIPNPKFVKPVCRTLSLSPVVSYDEAFADCAKTFISTSKRLFNVDFTLGEGGVTFKKIEGLEKEEYNVTVSKNGIVIEATESDGAHNAAATAYQLLNEKDGVLSATYCQISDKPDCSYRAIMLDMPANMRTFEQVLHYADICYLYKIKYLHLHLADNGGYNLPSKKFPKLPTPGKHYSLEQINALRKYCADRGIVIIPEVDVPGHATYLNVSYPELFGCTPIEGEARKDLVCIGKPGVMDNLKAIFEEVIELFPEAPYIHIGGDEAIIDAWNNCEDCKRFMAENGLKDVKALYTRSIKLLTDMILELGKTPVVWEGFPRDGAEEISRDVIVTAWESLYHLPNELLEEGFTVTNSSWMPLYVVDPNGYHGQFVKGGRWQPKDVLCDWDVYTWKNWWDKSAAYEKPIVVEPTDKVIGATFCAWTWSYDIDINPVKENVPAMCEKIWNVNSTYTYEEFEPALKKLILLAEALGPKA